MEKFTITHLAECASTSLLAREAVREGMAREGTAFRSDVQTGGKGRHGRHWASPRGNLHLSVVLRPGHARRRAEWPSLSPLAALALYDAIASVREESRIALKWPNDVLFDGCKCAGLLLEVEGDAVILGCGVNCATAPADDSAMRWQAGVLSDNAGEITPDAVLAAFECAFIRRYEAWQKEGFAAMRGDWCAASMHEKGDMLALDLGNDTIVHGAFSDIDDAGALCLADDNGMITPYHAGDVMRMHFGENPGEVRYAARH